MAKMRLLFVCLGNICRSPAAHGVMLSLMEKQNLSEFFEVDSAGTSGYHQGELPDPRMREHAYKRGIILDSLSRAFVFPDDFEKFDLILAMDFSNFNNLKKLTKNPLHLKKLRLMTDYCENSCTEEVPDPYFGGAEGFEEVLDLVTDGCMGIIKKYGPHGE